MLAEGQGTGGTKKARDGNKIHSGDIRHTHSARGGQGAQRNGEAHRHRKLLLGRFGRLYPVLETAMVERLDTWDVGGELRRRTIDLPSVSLRSFYLWGVFLFLFTIRKRGKTASSQDKSPRERRYLDQRMRLRNKDKEQRQLLGTRTFSLHVSHVLGLLLGNPDWQ